jgi:death-on-curing protein
MIRPQQVFHHSSDASLEELAGAYAYWLSRNHPFSDGNKRAAYLALETFCQLNGSLIQATQLERFQVMMALAAGEITEEALAAWIGQHFVPIKPPR